MLDNPQSLAGIITRHSSKSVAQTVDRLTRVIAPEFLAERHHIEGALRAPFDAVESIVEALVGA